MTQATTWGVPRNASEGNPTQEEWAGRADDSFDALLSAHKGSSRPSYAVAGTQWLDDSSTPWALKRYDGSADISDGLVDTVAGIIRRKAATYVSKSANYTALASDLAAFFRFTTTATLSLTAAATLGADWWCWVKADGGTITINPNGSETIDGADTLDVKDGESVLVICTGTAFFVAGQTLVRPFNSYGLEPRESGKYYAVEYSSDRSDAQLYGYTANIKRTGGNKKVVGAQLNAYDLSGSAPTYGVFGIACEAWTGDVDTEPDVGTGLIGIEPAIISQRHDSTDTKWGVDVVFKNRADGVTQPLHASKGDNKYNYDSRAINISSQLRSGLGEYCGWKRGIYFAAGSLDADTDGNAIGIDFSDAPTTRMDYAILLAEGQHFGLSAGASSEADVKIRYLDSANAVQFRNGATNPVSILVGGGSAGIAVNGVQVLAGQQSAVANATVGTEATTINFILARLRAHGLIASS